MTIKRSRMRDLQDRLSPEYRVVEPLILERIRLERRGRKRRFLWWTWREWEDVGFFSYGDFDPVPIVDDTDVARDLEERGVSSFLCS